MAGGTNFSNRSIANGGTVDTYFTNGAGDSILSRSTAANIPVAVTGYAAGGLLQTTDTGSLYINIGSATSANFSPVSGGGGGTTWEALYAADNVFNVVGGSGFSIAGGMANANNVVSITVDGGSSGAALSLQNSGSGADILGTNNVWQISTIGGAQFVTTNNTNNTTTATNSVLFTGSGVYTGTGANAFVNFTQSGLTTGDLFSVNANALTTGTAILVPHTTSVIASGGSLVRISSTSIDTGTTTGVLLDLASTASLAGTQVQLASILTTGTGMLLSSTGVMTTTGNLLTLTANSATTAAGILRINANGLTTGAGAVISSTGTMTTTGSLLTLTGNSATTAAGLFRVNANALTSGIGAVITSSATAITGAGRLLRVDHTGVTGTSAILSEFASAANDETVIVKVTASAALALGKVLQLSGTAVTTGTILDITGANALTTGFGINLTHTTSVIASGGSLAQISSTSIDTSTTTGSLLNLVSTASLAGTQVLATFSGLTTGIGESIVTGALTTGTAHKVTATAATLTTGFYYAANDGALNVFTVGANGHLTSNQTTAPTVGTNGTGLSAVAVTAGSTDTAGTITSTGTPASGTVITLTFHKTYTTAPKVVMYQAANAAAGGVNTQPIVTQTATTAVFTWPAGGVYAATPSWMYLVVA